MIEALIFSLLYSTGLMVTFHNRIEEFGDIVDKSESGEHRFTDVQCFGLCMWIMVCSMAWPIYWSGRLLYALPEQLALGPGEPQ